MFVFDSCVIAQQGTRLNGFVSVFEGAAAQSRRFELAW